MGNAIRISGDKGILPWLRRFLREFVFGGGEFLVADFMFGKGFQAVDPGITDHRKTVLSGATVF
jgi:hypothetical protein